MTTRTLYCSLPSDSEGGLISASRWNSNVISTKSESYGDLETCLPAGMVNSGWQW